MAQRKLAKFESKFGSSSAVSIQSQVRSNGEGTIRVQVDYSQVPAPDAYYVADYARIEAQGSTVQIIFGKLEGLNGARLRNKLEVNIPAYAFMGQWMGSLEFIHRLKESMDKKGFPLYETPRGIKEETDPSRVQTVHANSTFVSGGDNECCIDLYFLAPRDVRFYLERNDTPHLEPLIRIIVDARILVGLGESFSVIANEVRAYAPSSDSADASEVEEREL